MTSGFPVAKVRLVVFGAALWMTAAGITGCRSQDDGSTRTVQPIAGSLSITGTVFNASGNLLSGVTVRLAGSGQATATTGVSGTFAFNGIGAGSYSVQPSLSGCTFVPSVVNLNNMNTSQVVTFDGSGPSCGGPAQNSGATAGPFTISGRVANSVGNPVPGVKIFLNGSTQGVRTTTVMGTYSFRVIAGSYSVQPSGPCAFVPGVVNMNNLTASRVQNFVAGTGCAAVPQDAGTPQDASAPQDAPVDTGPGTPDAGTDVRDAAPDVCVPTTCAAAGRVCGPLADGCGMTLSCGTCATGQVCNPAGQCVQDCPVCPPVPPGGFPCGQLPQIPGCPPAPMCGASTCPNGAVCMNNVCAPVDCPVCPPVPPGGFPCGQLPQIPGCGPAPMCGASTCPNGQACVNNICPPVDCGPTTCPPVPPGGQGCGQLPNVPGCPPKPMCGPSCLLGQACQNNICVAIDCPVCPTPEPGGFPCGQLPQVPGCPPAPMCGASTCPNGAACMNNLCAPVDCGPSTCPPVPPGGQGCGSLPTPPLGCPPVPLCGPSSCILVPGQICVNNICVDPL